MRVGTYTRLSELVDPAQFGIERQTHDTASLVKLRGWRLEHQYSDPDVSAYQPKVVREDFERLLADLEAGVIQGIVVWDLDRLVRKPADLERIIAIYDRKPLVFATVQGDIDLSTPDGRTMARVLVAFANKASMDTARRVARLKLQNAIDGVGFSNYRPFGWNEDRLALNPSEAAILRQAAADVLSGTGLFIICTRLNRQGIRTVRGNVWKTHAMRRVLTAPRMAGFAVYQGELLTDSSGRPIKGKWEPILDVGTWRAVVEILTNTKRSQKQRGNTGLLTNIARCGKCGHGLYIARKRGTYFYECRSTDSGGCGGLGISGPKLEQQIELLLFEYLKGRQAEPEHTWSGQAQLDTITQQIGELMEQYRTNALSGSVVFPMIRRLEAERDELLGDQAKFTRLKARKSVSITGDWDDMDLFAKRAVIQSVIEAIVVRPVGRGVNRYDPDRVDVIPLG